jgi:hypothetical protein
MELKRLALFAGFFSKKAMGLSFLPAFFLKKPRLKPSLKKTLVTEKDEC